MIKKLVNIATVNNEDQYDDLSDDFDLNDNDESNTDSTSQNTDTITIAQLDIESTVIAIGSN